MFAPKLLASLLTFGAATTVAPAMDAPASSLYRSRLLWATVDVCNPKDQPDTIGIRGSMPSDGHPGDTMFMRFRVQYRNNTTKKWVDIAKGPASQGADSGFQPVGSTGGAREAGRNFQLVATSGGFTMRGVVTFQWRRGAHAVHTVTRPTTAGHKSLKGADPKGFSAATCTIA